MPKEKAPDTEYFVNTDETPFYFAGFKELIFKPGEPVEVPSLWIEDAENNPNLSKVSKPDKVDKATMAKLRTAEFKAKETARIKWREEQRKGKKAPEEANAPKGGE